MSESLGSKNDMLIKHLETKVKLAEAKREEYAKSSVKLSEWYDGYIQAHTEVINHLKGAIT